jgi:hypothetical protein
MRAFWWTAGEVVHGLGTGDCRRRREVARASERVGRSAADMASLYYCVCIQRRKEQGKSLLFSIVKEGLDVKSLGESGGESGRESHSLCNSRHRPR